MTNSNKNNSKITIVKDPKPQDKNNSKPLYNSIKDQKPQTLSNDKKSFTPPNSYIDENTNNKPNKGK